MTVARIGAETRGRRSVSGYPIYSGLQRDEYPPKVFLENAGNAHIKSIDALDNGGSGGYIGRAITPYYNGNQVELIDAPTYSASVGSLYCQDAYQ